MVYYLGKHAMEIELERFSFRGVSSLSGQNISPHLHGKERCRGLRFASRPARGPDISHVHMTRRVIVTFYIRINGEN